MKAVIPAIALFFALLAVGAVFAQDADQLPEPITEAVDSYLTGIYGEDLVAWSPTSRRNITEVPGDVECRVVDTGLPRGNTILTVNMNRRGRIWKRVPVSCRVLAFAWVPTASRNLDRHDVLNADNVRWERREITTVRGRWFDDPDEFSGSVWRTNRRVRRGDVLTLDRIEEKPQVLRGQQVSLVANVAGVFVETSGLALEDGSTGDRVRVQNPESGTQLYGYVEGEGKVQVQGVIRTRSGRQSP